MGAAQENGTQLGITETGETGETLSYGQLLVAINLFTSFIYEMKMDETEPEVILCIGELIDSADQESHAIQQNVVAYILQHGVETEVAEENFVESLEQLLTNLIQQSRQHIKVLQSWTDERIPAAIDWLSALENKVAEDDFIDIPKLVLEILEYSQELEAKS
jgi:hypothetical protein